MRKIVFRIFSWTKENQSDIILIVCVVLISFLSFAFGYIVAKDQERPELKFEDIINQEQSDEQLPYRNNS